jgi:glycine betaine/choline ABC-type transport system substrate-binding protein
MRPRPSFLFWTVVGIGVFALGCGRPVVVGSKNFTEQVVLGEVIALMLEEEGLAVDRKLNLGGSFICHNALTTGQMDVYVEYTGTALTAILKEEAIQDPQEVYRRVTEEYERRFDLAWGPPLGFNNTYALAMRSDEALRLDIRTISDLTHHLGTIRAGFGHEFLERQDGFPGLAAAYGLDFAIQPGGMELGLIYQALMENEVDLIAGSSTDALIEKFGLVVLEDDRSFFPPYYAAPVYRPRAAEAYPALVDVMQKLGGQIDEACIRTLNLAVDGERRSERQVAYEFLIEKGWIER